MPKKLIIVGDSAFAEIAFIYFSEDSEYEVVAFSVEEEFLRQSTLFDLPVHAFEALPKYYNPNQHDIFVAVTYAELNRLRKRLMMQAKDMGYGLASYVSSNAFIASNVTIGEHNFIFENNTLQPFVEIGSNVVVWSGNHIGHHSKIGNDCFISSHVVISGYCVVENNCFLGVNATLANNLTVGSDCWVGPNSLITKNLEKKSVLRSKQTETAKIDAHRFLGIKNK